MPVERPIEFPRSTPGSWFGRAGVTQDSVAIFGGLAGRQPFKFRVIHPFSAIEGITKAMKRDWEHEIGGGQGGGSQVFVPRMYQGHIRATGAHEGW